MSSDPRITIVKDGPYVVTSGVPLSEDAAVPCEDGTHLEYHHVKDYETQDEYHLCRCGRSHSKPFCDGSHAKADASGQTFHGEEVADKMPYKDRTDVFPGDELYLFDDNRCSYSRFCHRDGKEVWTLTEISGHDYHLKQEAVAASWHCPTGRLAHVDARTEKVYEDSFEPSIVLLEDVPESCSGPIFVRGGIPLEGADGEVYERRNRYALCRCGHSRNKPFCDATHDPMGFKDGSSAFEGTWGPKDETFTELPEVDA